MRKISGNLGRFIFIFCIASALFHIYTAYFGVLQPRYQRSIHLGFMMPLAFLLYPASRKNADKPPSLLDYFLSVLSIAVFCVYVLMNMERFQWRWQFIDEMTIMDMLCGGTAMLLLLEATRRAVAPAMAVLAVIALLYLFIGPYMPGVFQHDGFSIAHIIEMEYTGVDMDGIFGTLTAISSTFVAIFVIFGSFVSRTSIGQYFNDLALFLTGRSTGGPAKVAVISSGLFGMVSGVGASNVYTTGTFTIPLMKKIGFKPEFAGAVEAAASTGGQYMPPIMGSAAFIMAELSGYPYVAICKAAFISAILFYGALLTIVHLKALQLNIRGYSREEIGVDLKEVLRKSWNLLPIVILVACFALGMTPLLSAIYAIIATIIIGFIAKQIDIKGVFGALAEATRNTVLVALACACAGMIISVISHTGIGLSFTSLIVSTAQNSRFLALGFVMISCIILGMGLPTSAAYVMASTLAIPALMKLNLDLLACHLFILYSAIFSELTPPVAICAYVGAQIAKADPTKTGIEAFKLGIGALLLPYAFVTNPSLILHGTALQTVISVILAIAGLALVTWGIVGYFGKHWPNIIKNNLPIVRIALLASGVLVMFLPQISVYMGLSIWENL